METKVYFGSEKHSFLGTSICFVFRTSINECIDLSISTMLNTFNYNLVCNEIQLMNKKLYLLYVISQSVSRLCCIIFRIIIIKTINATIKGIAFLLSRHTFVTNGQLKYFAIKIQLGSTYPQLPTICHLLLLWE